MMITITKNMFAIIISAVVSNILIWLLVCFSNISIKSFKNLFSNLKLIPLLAVICSTFINFLITALKWRYISERIGIAGNSLSFYIFFVGLSAIFSILLPPNISFFFVRSLALKLLKGFSLTRSGFSLIYENILGFFSVLLFLPILITFWIGITHETEILILGMGVIILGLGAMIIYMRNILRLCAIIYNKIRNTKIMRNKISNIEFFLIQIQCLISYFS